MNCPSEPGIDPGILDLSTATVNGAARRAAMKLLEGGEHTPTSVVSYQSGGHVLIHSTGAPDPIVVENLLNAGLECSVLVSGQEFDDVNLREGPHKVDQIEGSVSSFEGYLGDFRVALKAPQGDIQAEALVGRKDKGFDLVLDLAADGLSPHAVSPPGYFRLTEQDELSVTVDELSSMVGEFDKPKYFDLDPNICAHTSRGVTGCTRCLDVCPTLAISSAEESVTVDPYLCQGVGVCTTVCPTGAITYAFPRVNDLLDDIRRALHCYHDAGGESPVLLFHDDETGRQWLNEIGHDVAGNVIPVEVESAASIGIDVWLSSLAYGARHICLLVKARETTPEIVESVHREIAVTRDILGAMGYDGNRIELIEAEKGADVLAGIPHPAEKQLVSPAGFAGFNEKRTTIYLALEHFYEHAPRSRKSIPLGHGSSFGRVKVDKKACTLCMSCAAVCPSGALVGGSGLPKLMFLERNCVQCGMCEKACPENAVSLESRFNFEAQERDQPQVMYEEEPFNCVKCGKPFSTQSMMTRIRDKLKGHWMYQDSAQMSRLEMCDNCRIEDMYVNGGGLDPYERSDKPSGSDV